MKVVSVLLVAMLACLLSLSQTRAGVILDPFEFEAVPIDCRSEACHYDWLPYCTERLGKVRGSCALKHAVCDLGDRQVSCVELASSKK